MKKKSLHMARVESLVQQSLAQLISREIDLPEFGMITVTAVRVSRDLSQAKVYVLGHDESKKNEMIKKLKASSKKLRHLLAGKVDLRKTPELHFFYDEVLSQGIRITQLLQEQ